MSCDEQLELWLAAATQVRQPAEVSVELEQDAAPASPGVRQTVYEQVTSALNLVCAEVEAAATHAERQAPSAPQLVTQVTTSPQWVPPLAVRSEATVMSEELLLLSSLHPSISIVAISPAVSIARMVTSTSIKETASASSYYETVADRSFVLRMPAQ